MSDMMQTRANFLAQKRHGFVSSDITYIHGAHELTIKATKGRSEWDQTDETGIFVRTRAEDFIVLVTELYVGEERLIPEEGNIIRETIDGKINEYQVMAFPPEPAWRYDDGFQKSYRLHTKKVAEYDE